MKRLHLLEIEDQAWCPTLIRDCVTDYLQRVITGANTYAPIAERLRSAVARAAASRIVDLCSGGGGPWPRLEQTFAEHGPSVEILLTDFHPNAGAIKRAQSSSAGRFKYHPYLVSALRVPTELTGF